MGGFCLAVEFHQCGSVLNKRLPRKTKITPNILRIGVYFIPYAALLASLAGTASLTGTTSLIGLTSLVTRADTVSLTLEEFNLNVARGEEDD